MNVRAAWLVGLACLLAAGCGKKNANGSTSSGSTGTPGTGSTSGSSGSSGTSGTTGTTGTSGSLVPANDTCASPATLTAGQSVDGDTTHATDDLSPSASATACTGYAEKGPDVIYAFTPTVSGLYTFTVTPKSVAYDSAIYVLKSCPTSGSTIAACVGGSDQGSAGQPDVVGLQLTGGTLYYVVVDGSDATHGGPFSLVVQAGAGTTGGSGGTTGAVGTVSTLAGDGNAGFVNGPGSTAEFKGPSGVAVDRSGNVYVADVGNHAIRKIDPSGAVTTLAGSGMAGFADGAGIGAAQFNGPSGAAVDASGNVYVADMINNRIRKIDPSGNVTTVAGNGGAAYLDGTGPAAAFSSPSGVAVDAQGNLYVADQGNNRIRKIDPSRAVTTLAGNGTAGFVDGTGGPAGTAEFHLPTGVTVDAAGNIYVADRANNRIRKIDAGGNVTTLAGNGRFSFSDGTGGAAGMASFFTPYDVTADAAGDIFVADAGNERVRVVGPDGTTSTVAGNGTPDFADGTGGANGTAEFHAPSGVAVGAAGAIYVADLNNNRVRVITP